MKKPGKDVIPTPYEMVIDKDKTVDLATGNWVILSERDVSNEAKILKGDKIPVATNLLHRVIFPNSCIYTEFSVNFLV
jgi:hypothetical protein